MSLWQRLNFFVQNPYHSAHNFKIAFGKGSGFYLTVKNENFTLDKWPRRVLLVLIWIRPIGSIDPVFCASVVSQAAFLPSRIAFFSVSASWRSWSSSFILVWILSWVEKPLSPSQLWIWRLFTIRFYTTSLFMSFFKSSSKHRTKINVYFKVFYLKDVKIT